MTISPTLPPFPDAAAARLALVLGGSLLALAGCNGTALPDLDWDLRAGPGNTSEEARQATAAKPVPDANGVLSYPGYQLAQARRGDTIASMAARLGLNPDELARTNALKPDRPAARGRAAACCPAGSRPCRSRSAADSAAAPGSRPVDITAIATTALDEAGGRRPRQTRARRRRGRQGAGAPQGRPRRDRLHHRAGLQCLGQGAGGMERAWPRHGACARARR
jgi:hypothetical protein